MLLPILSIILGFVLLIKGADWLVSGASDLARTIGFSDLVIGLTVVAFGTSAPELIVNIVASLRGNTDIAIGNIVGSNIANILLILGAVSIVSPLVVRRSTVLKEIPFGLLAAILLFIMANDSLVDGYPMSELGRGDGFALIAFFVIFMFYTFGLRRESREGHSAAQRSPLAAWAVLLLGIAVLAIGGHLTVEGATGIARLLGVTEVLIGLTVVSVGTSLPELATSLVAGVRGKADIAVGNIAGSNIFNIFWILGVSSLIKPLPFAPALNFDLLVVILATLLLFLIIHNGGVHRRLLRWWLQGGDYILRRSEGAILLLSYVAYVGYIIWRDIGGGL